MQNKKHYSIIVILTLSAIVGILTLSLSSISLSNENIPLVNALNATSIDSPFANATSIDSPWA